MADSTQWGHNQDGLADTLQWLTVVMTVNLGVLEKTLLNDCYILMLYMDLNV
jgi:hypothetical protein